MIEWWWILVGIGALIVLAILLMLVFMRHELRRYLRMERM